MFFGCFFFPPFTACQLWRRREDPNSAESAEEAALKAWGPMPCALLIVTRAFLPSNSDWRARRFYSSQETSGGGKTRCWSPISLVRGLTRATRGRRAFGAPSLDTGLVSPPLPHNRPIPLPSYRSWSIPPTNTAQPPHLICSSLSARPRPTAHLPPLRHVLSSWQCDIFDADFFNSLFVFMPIKTHFKSRKHMDCKVRSRQEQQLDS